MAERRDKRGIVTASDVARFAGVSQATVSRVFNKDCKIRINPESRQRVLDAAEELGYIPNAIAQIMKSGRSGIIGIVVSSYFNLFYYQILEILTNRLMDLGFRAMVFTSDPKEDINALMESLYQYQVDGVIVTSSALSHHVTSKWIKKGMPVTLLNGYMPEMEISAVQSDQYGSGKTMAEYLMEVGHQRFAYVSSENSLHKNYIPRQRGFMETLEKNGVRECKVIPGGYSYESGLEAGRALLSEPSPPDAIFCSGDLNALGVIDAVRERKGLRLGVDISVTGYDAPILPALNAYSLTGMTQQTHRLCMDCVDLLQRLIESPDLPPQVITRPMTLTIRGSSRKREEYQIRAGKKPF